MGWLSKLNPITSAIESGANVADRFIYTKQERAADKAEQQREVRAKRHELKLKQLEINAIDAKSGRWIQCSWRPLTSLTCLFIFGGCGLQMMIAFGIFNYAVLTKDDEMLGMAGELTGAYTQFLPFFAPYISTLAALLGFAYHTRRKEGEAGVKSDGIGKKPEPEIPQSLGRFVEDVQG